MNKCVGPLSECVNALQEILENLIKIQEDIVCGQQLSNQETMYINDAPQLSVHTSAHQASAQPCGQGGGGGVIQSSGRSGGTQGNHPRSTSPNTQSNTVGQRPNTTTNKSSNRNKEIIPIDGTPEDGTDCNEYLNNPNSPDTPWYCLPPAKSQTDYEDCICPDGSSQTDVECDENENESISNYNDSLQDDDCCDKLNVQRTADGYQRIIAVRENCDGSVSKIYALRKNIKPPTTSNRKVDDCLNELPIAESTKNGQESGSCVNPEDNSEKNSLQSFRYRNKHGQKETRKNPDNQLNRNPKNLTSTQKGVQLLTQSSGKNMNTTPQTLNNAAHTEICGKNPFEELQLIIEKERKRLDMVCHGGDKLLSSIEKDRKCSFEKTSTEKSSKRNADDKDRKSNCTCDIDNERKLYNDNSCEQIANDNGAKNVASRIPNPLSEDEATLLLDQMIDTTIKGLDKIAKSLNCYNQEFPSKPQRGSSTLNCSEIEKLKKHQEVTEQKISCLRMSVHEMLVNMSEVLSTKIDVPEIQEMAKDLKIYDCRCDILLQDKLTDKF